MTETTLVRLAVTVQEVDGTGTPIGVETELLVVPAMYAGYAIKACQHALTSVDADVRAGIMASLEAQAAGVIAARTGPLLTASETLATNAAALLG